MVKIASWNVNSVKARLPNVLDWLKSAQPDIVLLQEIKCVEEGFPSLEIGDLGYNAAVSGQKTYNGVAILSKTPLEVAERRLPGGDGDDHARYIEATTKTAAGFLRVASIYLPNGNPIGTEKFSYKLGWMERLHKHARALLRQAPILLLDEATSALDSESEAAIQAALVGLMRDKTVIAIAHRLSTLRAMDRIVVVEQGRIVEDGSHEALVRHGGTYASLWNSQVSGFIPD